ncbi:MAG: DMT family transporter, partial [Rhizobiaceae bacterium]
MTQNKTHLAYILLILTCLFWGGNAVAGKMAVGNISPMLLTLMRWVIAIAILWLFALGDLKRDWPVIRQNWLLLSCYGAFGFTLFNVLLYSALTRTTAVNASIVQAAIPASVYLFNFLIFKVRVTTWQIAGFFVTLFGVLTVATQGDVTRLATLDLNMGDAMILFAVAVYALYTVFLRYKPQINWKSLILILAIIACLSSLPFAFYEWQSGAMIIPTAIGAGVMVYAAIFPSIISQILFIKGVELIGPNRA